MVDEALGAGVLRRTSGLFDGSAGVEPALVAGGGLPVDDCIGFGAGDAAAVEVPGVAPGVEVAPSASGRGFRGTNLGLKPPRPFNMELILKIGRWKMVRQQKRYPVCLR